LRNSFLALFCQPIFHDSAPEHPIHQPKHSFVSDSHLQHLSQPRVVHMIEKAFDVRFDDVTDFLLLDRSPKFIQCIELRSSVPISK
jgi:hypothetical protein